MRRDAKEIKEMQKKKRGTQKKIKKRGKGDAMKEKKIMPLKGSTQEYGVASKS
jgi:hypothetical protein